MNQSEANIVMPSERLVGPVRELMRRVIIGVVMMLIVAVGTWLERTGYHDSAGGSIGWLDSLYYATVTITTTGYGDMYPVTETARLFTTFVVTPARIVFLVLLVGTSVELIAYASRSAIRERSWRRRVRDHVVICGFGVKGRTAFESLREDGFSREHVVVIDPNEEAIAEATNLGCVGILGEATRDGLLRAARIDRASCVVVATNSDDSTVLTTLSVRNMSPNVRIVAAARELENAPLIRRSGADVVLSSSGAAGRMLGLAAHTPHYVQVIEELLERGTGFDLVERKIAVDEDGLVQDKRLPGELVIAVFRGDDLIQRNPGGSFCLQAGDQLVSVSVADSNKR